MTTTTCATHTTIEPSVLYFGTPVSLISTVNPDGTANLAPMSSSWYLGHTVVLGISEHGQTIENLRRERGCVVNLPSAELHPQVERLAPLTGRSPVPAHKADRFRHHAAKFEAAGLHPMASEVVTAPRVRECPVQLEAVVEAIHPPRDDGFEIVECRVVRVHVARDLVVPGTDHVDTGRWEPLLYVFRHYFGTGTDLGANFRAEY